METALAIISLIGLILLLSIVIWLVAIRKHFNHKTAKVKKSKVEATTKPSPSLPQETIDAIRNAASESIAEDEIPDSIESIDQLDEEGEMAIQRIAIAQNLQEAAGEEKKAAAALKDSAKELLEAEEAMMNAQMHRDVRIDEQKKNLDKEIEAKRAEIEAKAKLAREEMLSDEQINLEKRQKALEEIARQKEIELTSLREWADVELKRIDEKSKLEREMANNKAKAQDEELNLLKKRKAVERELRTHDKIEATQVEIERIMLNKAKEKGKKRKSLFGELATVSAIVITIGMIGIIIEKLF